MYFLQQELYGILNKYHNKVVYLKNIISPVSVTFHLLKVVRILHSPEAFDNLCISALICPGLCNKLKQNLDVYLSYTKEVFQLPVANWL